jgi:putative chitobiose transport system substrate-binding protein
LIKTFPDSTDASLGSGNDEQLRLIFDNEIVAFLTGKKTADEALADAEKSWNTELAKPR